MLVSLHANHNNSEHHSGLAAAHAIAQAHALMIGNKADQDRLFRHCSGGKPSTLIMFERLTPEMIGQLIALYEHRTFTQSIIWGINPFDQWGVEWGKTCASEVLNTLFNRETQLTWDGSSDNLIQWAKAKLAKSSDPYPRC
jgi:glucose-6-phosphate isomerase